jgi:hypothetical protein
LPAACRDTAAAMLVLVQSSLAIVPSEPATAG